MSFNFSNISSSAINSSKNALLIQLEEVQLEDIIEKKLNYFLQQRPLGRQILKTFYEPVEQAVIELFLEKQCGNQFKTDKLLGINRNTLKKKILNYDLSIQKVFNKEKKLLVQNRIFVGSISSLDLLSVCRVKLLLDNSHNRLPQDEVLDKICQPVEKKIVETMLAYCKGNQIRTANFLGINRNTLKKKLSFKPKVKAS